jgi:hypothetical protein
MQVVSDHLIACDKNMVNSWTVVVRLKRLFAEHGGQEQARSNI